MFRKEQGCFHRYNLFLSNTNFLIVVISFVLLIVHHFVYKHLRSSFSTNIWEPTNTCDFVLKHIANSVPDFLWKMQSILILTFEKLIWYSISSHVRSCVTGIIYINIVLVHANAFNLLLNSSIYVLPCLCHILGTLQIHNQYMYKQISDLINLILFYCSKFIAVSTLQTHPFALHQFKFSQLS
jgi:hypothetical protein